MKPIPVVSHVDIQKFMGDWYVIACIPTFIETDAYNAIESYRLNDDGSIATTFTFRKGAPDGPLKKYTPTGHIIDKTSNAVWGMQFIWPIDAEYLIAHLEKDYRYTIIARNARDYVWIMARAPRIPGQDYERLSNIVKILGYDVTLLRKIPQQW
ncbi:lipocalin family protein [Methylococcus mesophilus]|uniref:lipocalin family protein n=1 Tax=Methylococcus mesophilus TaxID=2993564 RepID=UPI00224A7B02|nr:lipocalin family protein [Methylococcus mesophilus]UZR30438.1 lipocalin family protein [Methylococcus mesophilus]